MSFADETPEIKSGEIVSAISRVGDWQPQHQVIVIKPLDKTSNPLLLVESRGKLGSVHFLDLRFLDVFFDI